MATVERELILDNAARIRDTLIHRLRVQRQHYLAMLAWYVGEQPPPGLPREATGEIYRRIRESSRNTWAALIVDSIAERLEVHGWRSGAGDVELEQAAWQLLQANRIDDEQRQVHVDALLAGRGYALVMPDADTGEVRITPESPLEVTHLWQPGGRREVRAALKLYALDGGWWRAELYGPDLVLVWIAETDDEPELDPFGSGDPAATFAHSGDPLMVDNDLGVVPVVPFENRKTTSSPPLSEVEQVEHVLERIDELLVGRQVASHFAAFRQKWATGLEVPKDPETNKPVEPFKAAVQKVWISEDADSRFGSFEATELSQYTNAIEAEVAELAAISRVPAHYFVQGELANPPSADSIIASEAGLVQKCRDRQRGFGESWETVVRLGLQLAGTTLDRVGTSDEAVWRDPAVRSPSQLADAAAKLQTIGVPREALWQRIGASPQEIERWRAMAAEEDLRAAILGAPPAPAE